MGRRRGRLRAMFVLAAVLGLCLPAGAFTQGVAVDLGRVEVDDQLRAGQRYTLPTIGVTNRGTESASFTIVAGPMEGVKSAPSSWFRLEPDSFDLDPGATQPVSIALALPLDAEPARYQQLISARIAPDGEGIGLGAAAASLVSFEVVPSTIWEGMWNSAISFFRAGHPWSTLAVGVIVLFFLAGWVRRNFELAIRRRA